MPQPIQPPPRKQVQPAPDPAPTEAFIEALPTAQLIEPAAKPIAKPPATQPAAAQPAVAQAGLPVARPAFPVARPAASPQPGTPVYAPATPVAQVQPAATASPIYAALSQANVAQPAAAQPYVAQPYVAQPYVAQPYVAPLASAAYGVPVGTIVEEPPAARDYSAELWEVQRLLLGTRVWVAIVAWVGALSALTAMGRVLFILYVTSGRLTPVLIGACLGMMLSTSIGLVVAFQIFGYAGRMGDFLRDPTRYWLEQTLAAERSVWRTMGVLVIVLVLLGVILTMGLVAGAVMFEQLSR